MSLSLRKRKSKWNAFRTEYSNLNGGTGADGVKCLKQTTLEFKESVGVKPEKASIDDDVWDLLKKAIAWEARGLDEKDNINLRWIQENSATIPDDSKIPILLVSVLRGIQKGNCITLMDKSGSIEATIDDFVISNYRSLLVFGTCLAIKKCLLSYNGRGNVCLSIANPNVIFVASKKAFTKDDLRLPSLSDYVFFRKPNNVGVAFLQFDTVNYQEINEEERALLKLVTGNAKIQESGQGDTMKTDLNDENGFHVFDDDDDEFLIAVAAEFD